MSEPQSVKPASHPSSAMLTDTVARKTGSPRRSGGSFFALRRPVPQWQGLLLGLTCILAVLAIWYALTAGEQSEDRILPYTTLPSPAETFSQTKLKELW